ncbi:hypothetical protein VKT23_004928 [Stygiomarasmius scandens]|uniref:C2H2-type domain-containing protein n=1 Tax=Marasmiellus scandens TaxID=2682957 RepID=A0ABR1JSL9_9AGAR
MLKPAKFDSSSSPYSSKPRSGSDHLGSSMRLSDINDPVSFEHKFCSNFFCCNMRLSGMHELLEHVEEVHIMSPLAPSAGSTQPTSAGPNRIPHHPPYNIVCAYPEPSTPPSHLFESEYDWSTSVYPDSQPDSPLVEDHPEMQGLDDSISHCTFFPQVGGLFADTSIDASQTTYGTRDFLEHAKDTATSGVITHHDGPHASERGSSDAISSNPDAAASISRVSSAVSMPSTIPGPIYNPISLSAGLLNGVHSHMPYSGGYSSQVDVTYMPTHISPVDALKSTTSSASKARSSGPSRRARTKTTRKSPTALASDATTGFTQTEPGTAKATASGATRSSGGSRALRGTKGELLTQRDGQLIEKVPRKAKISRKERKHRCPIPGCTKVYLNANGLKYHLDKGTCKIEPVIEDDCVPMTASSSDPQDWEQDMDIESSPSPVIQATGAPGNEDLPPVEPLQEHGIEAAFPDTHVQGRVASLSQSTEAMSLSASSSVQSHPLTLLTSPLTTHLPMTASPTSSISPTSHPAHPSYFAHEYPQQTSSISNDSSDTSSDDDDDDGQHDQTRVDAVDVKKLHMPVPHVAANFWAVDTLGRLSE